MVFDDGFFSESAQGYYYARAFAFVQALENGCARSNTTLKRVRCSDLRKYKKLSSDTLGIIVWANSGTELTLRNDLVRFTPLNCPAVFVTMDNEVSITGLTSENGTMIISPNDREAGWRLGMYALGRGYKKAAFFGSSNQLWSKKREQGFLSAYQEAGPEYSVTVFKRQDVVDKNSDDDNPHLQKTIDRWIDTFDKFEENKGIRTVLAEQLSDAVDLTARSRSTKAQFESAIKDRSIQVCVIDSDTLAVHVALPFVKSTRPISLLCFENSIASFSHDLMTVDFNYAGAAYQALRLCLFPDRKALEKGRTTLIDIPITICCRGSG